jgi:uncharacterized membrane protein
MSGAALTVLAAGVAGAMAFLVRAGATASLRSALRTSAVVLLGWTLAYRAHGPMDWPSVDWRTWVMVGLSGLAAGLGWGLYFRDARLPEPSPAAVADKVNVFIAAGVALLMILGNAPQRYAFSVLLTAGAVILAGRRG